MGVDLTIVPQKYQEIIKPELAYERLSFSYRNYELWNDLKTRATPFTHGLQWYGDEGIVTLFDDAYGETLQAVTVHQFMKSWREHVEDNLLYFWDKAIIAFLGQLPKHHLLILYFH